MTVLQIRASNVRCLRQVTLEPATRNLIFGENASGKTSLLEAIFVVGRGRSFRGAQRKGLIRDGESEAVVSASVRKGERCVPLGIGINRDGRTTVRIAGQEQSSLATLAEWLPVQVLDPDLHRLVDEGPGERRRFVDWGVFHVEQRFLDTWRRYHRSLRQRNALLKQKRVQELDAWDERLAVEGEALDGYRRAYLESVVGDINKFAETLLETPLALEYRSGWAGNGSLAEALLSTRERDIRVGATQAGPHRADMHIGISDRQARGRVSRGQQKLLAASLVLGQLHHLERSKGLRSVLLVDDAAAELDRGRLTRLMTAVSSLEAQLFVTALDPGDLDLANDFAVFHVEQGKVSTMV